MGEQEERNREYVALRSLLRAIRREAGISQAELATRLGVPQSFVSKIESGERRIDIVELRRICVALECSFGNVIALLERNLDGVKETN